MFSLMLWLSWVDSNGDQHPPEALRAVRVRSSSGRRPKVYFSGAPARGDARHWSTTRCRSPGGRNQRAVNTVSCPGAFSAIDAAGTSGLPWTNAVSGIPAVQAAANRCRQRNVVGLVTELIQIDGNEPAGNTNDAGCNVLDRTNRVARIEAARSNRRRSIGNCRTEECAGVVRPCRLPVTADLGLR